MSHIGGSRISANVNAQGAFLAHAWPRLKWLSPHRIFQSLNSGHVQYERHSKQILFDFVKSLLVANFNLHCNRAGAFNFAFNGRSNRRMGIARREPEGNEVFDISTSLIASWKNPSMRNWDQSI